MTLSNKLLYYEYVQSKDTTPSVHKMNDVCLSNLWHGRLVHTGHNVMANIHKHVIGIDKPIKQNPLYKCGSCLPNKMRKASHKRAAKHKQNKEKYHTQEAETPINSADNPEYVDDIKMTEGVAGQHFHMDFSFVRGSSYSRKMEDLTTLTSIDGYNLYLIIINRVTRYGWIFLTSSKYPPITIAQKVLEKFKCKNPHRTVRTDQGVELGLSHDFQHMIADKNLP